MLAPSFRSLALRRLASAAKFSTADSPKITIAKNILLLSKISEATCEESLKKVLASPLPSVDIADLPADLKDLAPYFKLSEVSSSEKYVPDPTAWQNMSMMDMVVTESQREETWPFIVGFL
jgi:hypothetical protein